MPLQGRTRLAKDGELERRKSAMVTLPSTQVEPLELSSLEDEVQQCVNEKKGGSDDVFSMMDFDFMPVGIELVGDKIRDTPIGKLQQEDWTQMLPDTQGPNLTHPSLP